MQKKKITASNLTKMALCIAILAVSSYVIIPLPFTPIVLTMHTVAVNLIGLLLSPTQAGCTILIYLLMGLMGFPVFSGGTAGPGKLFGQTGGFYFGFLFAVIAISFLKGNRRSLKRYALVTIGVGIPIQHTCGILFACYYNEFNLELALLTVSLPFIPGDLIKCVIASSIAVALNRTKKKQD